MKILSPAPVFSHAYDKTALSVNVNKVALLRNSRHLDI
ncbi:MAG: pyridoxine 5'-phosphate synthase, partial [Bacteroidia bacterium]|nr:pyridoxine 5'-phosphate synthase [Bacteroidia bacterium]